MAVSGVFLAFALRGLKFDEFFLRVREANYLWLLPSVGVYFLGVWARTWRWHYMLRPLKSVALYPLFRIVCIGYMGNNIFPARAGEVLRSYVLRREESIRMSASLATVLVERLFDGLVMLSFVFIALPFVNLNAALSEYRWLIGATTVLFLTALFVFLLLASRPALAQRIYIPLFRHLLPEGLAERAIAVGDRFMTGFASLSSSRDVFLIFATSVLVWLFETGKYWFVMQAFDFQVSFFTLMLMNGVVNLATTIPAAPGHIGTFDAPGIAILEAAGVDQATATAYTLVLHVALWLPITALGAFYLWRSHISLSDVQGEMETEGADEKSAREADASRSAGPKMEAR